MGFLGGCSHVISSSGRELVNKSIAYTEIRNNPESLVGTFVLLGGIIAENRSSSDIMQLEVVQLDLFDSGFPNEFSRSEGRFLVVSGELFEPHIYQPGTLITLVGEIKGVKVQKLGSADYRYPLVSAKEIHLFRSPEESAIRSYNNPYQSQVGDSRFMLRPPGVLSEPRF